MVNPSVRISAKRALGEGVEPNTFRDKLRNSASPLHITVLNGIWVLSIFCFVKIFGPLAYEKNYLKGKWFEHPWSLGWRWAFSGMFSKLFTGHGRGIPWPVGRACDCGRNVDFDIDALNCFQGNIYFQIFGDARIKLGRGVWIARGCALITANHDLANPDLHTESKSIEIGDHCWLGTNVVIMPGVVLGPHTVVGANAVVTKGFPEGHCVLGGVPAKVIKRLDNTLEKEADR